MCAVLHYNVKMWESRCGLWYTSPGAIPGAMTDGLVEVIGVSGKLLLSDSVSMGRVSSNGSTPSLVGKISADPNTVRKVTSESTKTVATRAAPFDPECASNRLSAQTPLGELTALPIPPSWFRGWAPGKGKEEGKGKGGGRKRKGGEGKGRGRGGDDRESWTPPDFQMD